jgi:uncharacterized membrane protein
MSSVVVLLGLIIAFCFGTSDYLSKGLTGQVGFYRTTVYTLALSGVLVAAPSSLLGAPELPSAIGVLVLVLLAVATFLAFLCMYRGYQKGNLAVISPTVNSFPVFSVIFAIFALKIHVSGTLLAVLGGVVVGILLVSTNLSSLGASKGRLTPGLAEGLLAAFFFAVGFTLLGYADETMGYFIPVVAARLGGGCVGFLAAAPLKQGLTPFGGKSLQRVATMAVLEAAGLFTFNAALSFYSIGGLPILTTLAGMGVVFTVSYALILLKEKIELNYAVGIGVLVVSVAALLFLTA